MGIPPEAVPGRASPRTILLVEDEAIVAADEARLLRDEGYAVLVAADGKKAVETVKARPGAIDLILMDIDLGKGMDGARAAREILKERDIPVLFLSSHTEREIVEKTEKISSYGYVVKDSGVTVLSASIKMALKLHEAHRELDKHERALWESRERFSNAFEHAAIGMALVSPEGRWLKVNGSLCEIVGYPEDELLTKAFQDITHPEDLDADLALVRRMLAGEISTYQMEKRYFHKSGRVVCVLLSVSLIRDNAGKPLYFISQIQNITERKRAEEALREGEARYRSLFEHMEEGAALCRMQFDDRGRPQDFTYLQVNPAFERLTGLKGVEGRRVTEVIPGIKEQTPGLLEAYGRVASTGQPEKFELDFTPLGIWLSVSVYSPGKGDFVAIFDNITERKRTEEEIKRAQILLRSSLESQKEMIILSIDKEHRYLFFNDWHRQVMRAVYGKDVRIGMDLLECVTNDDDRRKARINYDRALAGDAHSTIEEYGELDRSYYETFYNPIVDEEGRIIGATAFARNVTERKRWEEALKESVRQKEILMKELQHRVKNSLAVVSGLLGLGMETLTDVPSKAVFADTRSRIRSIASLYEQLYATADAAHVDLKRYIEQLATALFDTYTPNTGGIRLRADLAEVTLDTKRAVPVGLILNELVMNAIKYAYPPGEKGEIRVALERSAGAITLSVSDDGAGLPRDFVPATSGGMGWSLVRMLTEEIDARLTVENEGGCRVHIAFDLKEA